ncbi:SAM-dependent methyltransferase [Halobacteriales archaeon QH_3_68_24]|nr:MAG: SAM-dependent methyltransferase [Halobacteriales archaeon QH_3_68_24]
MAVPCVRVPREEGEATRQRLAADGLVSEAYEIELAEGHLYIPVTDPSAVGDLPVVERDPDPREGQTMPADLVEDPSYERVGDVVVIDEDDPDRADRVAAAVVESDLPVDAVLDRASKVKGQDRVRDWEVLAGDGTETVHREYGCEYLVDLAEAFFSPRLATERHRVAEQVEAGEHAFDMFAGVGPFVVPFARRGATVVGADVNPEAIAYLRENARRNGVAERVTAIEGDVREVVPDYGGWADRVVMNLPHSADEFLDTAVLLAGEEAVIHYYDIQHEEDPFGPGEAAIRRAAEPDYEATVETRRRVRSYAPHEVNVCLDVRLARA